MAIDTRVLQDRGLIRKYVLMIGGLITDTFTGVDLSLAENS